MMRIAALLLGLSVATFGGLPQAMAQETGLDGLHAQRKEGNRVCMMDHFHYGTSSGQADRKAAERAAAGDWSGFVALEYGLSWATFATAGSKKVDCSQAGGKWGCQVEARPCKRVRRS